MIITGTSHYVKVCVKRRVFYKWRHTVFDIRYGYIVSIQMIQYWFFDTHWHTSKTLKSLVKDLEMAFSNLKA